MSDELDADRVTTVLRIDANLTTGRGLKVRPEPVIHPIRYDPDFWSAALASATLVVADTIYNAAKTDGGEEMTYQQVLDGLRAMTSLKIQKLHQQMLAQALARMPRPSDLS